MFKNYFRNLDSRLVKGNHDICLAPQWMLQMIIFGTILFDENTDL